VRLSRSELLRYALQKNPWGIEGSSSLSIPRTPRALQKNAEGSEARGRVSLGLKRNLCSD